FFLVLAIRANARDGDQCGQVAYQVGVMAIQPVQDGCVSAHDRSSISVAGERGVSTPPGGNKPGGVTPPPPPRKSKRFVFCGEWLSTWEERDCTFRSGATGR